jgi:8-oxo-dGTP diphosphatase
MAPEQKPVTFPHGLKRAAVFCIIKSGEMYLLLKRAKPPYKGKFVPVGGKINPYESPKDAVVREVQEETGLQITLPEFCGVLTESSPVEYNWISYIYKVSLEAFIPAPACDEGELIWIHEEDLHSIDMPPTDLAIYQFAMREQKFSFQALFDAELTLLTMTDDLTGLVVYP